ncbi:flagellar hook capping FlgD N-terminal domain-containing protein [Vibrio sp. PNB22_3_1]
MQVGLSSNSPMETNSNLGVSQSAGDNLSNEFLTLMVAQIQNQDPLEPTDSTQYINQMAQLTMVESNENLVQLTQSNQVLLDNLQVLSTTTLVGQTVEVKSSSVEVEDGKSIDGRIRLDASASAVTLQIKSSNGDVVEKMLGPQTSGDVAFTLDPSELDLEDGNYTVSVVTDGGQTYQPTIYLEGVVDQVNINSSSSGMTLSVNGIGEVPVYEISRFG